MTLGIRKAADRGLTLQWGKLTKSNGKLQSAPFSKAALRSYTMSKTALGPLPSVKGKIIPGKGCKPSKKAPACFGTMKPPNEKLLWSRTRKTLTVD